MVPLDRSRGAILENSGTFFHACGALESAQIELQIHRTGHAPVRRWFAQPSILIGRNPCADLVLEHGEIGNCHTYLQVIAGRLHGLELGGLVDGTPPDPAEDDEPGWIEPGHEIGVGPYRVRARLIGVHPPGNPRDLQSAYPPPQTFQFARRFPHAPASLEVERRERTTSHPIRRVLTLIGRSPRCSIRVNDPDAPWFLAALVATADGPWVVDLNLREEVYINTHRRRFARLEHGDLLQVGRFRMRIRRESEQAPVPLPPRDASPEPVPGPGLMVPGLPLPGVLGRPEHSAQETLAHSDQYSERMFRQMGQMQHQMNEQFQQTLLMITQMFGTMHREQMDVIREELAHIRSLTEQMQQYLPPQGRPFNPSSPPQSPTDPEPDVDPCRDPKEIEAFVSQKLAAFERERQARWKNLMKLLSGN